MSLSGVISLAKQQLGTVEDPAGSNNVIYNTDYYGHPVSGSSYPWCVTFLWDIFRMAGESSAFYGGQKTASCTALKNYYNGQNRWFSTGTPKVGDIAIMSFSYNQEIQHCGLIVDISGSTYYTVEGNTSPGLEGSQDNGGCVAYKERKFGTIVGFCRVIYSDETDSGGPVDDVSSDSVYNSFNNISNNVLNPQSNNLGSITKTQYSSQLLNVQETRDFISRVDNRNIDAPDQGTSLLSYPSLVEAPYINVDIGGFTFGKYNETRTQNGIIINYPNFITSLDIIKVNGQVNMYTINMLYQIRVGDDPNFIDKILSSVGYGKIKISYGDYASPSFIYKEEEAIITKVTSRVNFSTSSIQYTISCTSTAMQLLATNYYFPYHAKEKPSNIIKEMLQQASFYRLDTIFPALTGKKNFDKNFSRFIATDDQAVEIPAKNYMDPLSYINFLVTYMIPETDNAASTQRSATYYLTIHDDSYADYSDVGGTYFKITKISSTYRTIPTFNTYTVDVGYPGGDNPGENLVMDFSITDDNSWALLYDYAQTDMGASLQNYSYSINDYGETIQHYSPNATINSLKGKTTAAMKSWWTRMTEFPVSATLIIKGLVRSAMLMSYIRVNAFFYGRKHVSSGLYIVTKQQDKIDGSGYRTVLSLTRIAGADEYIVRKTYNRQVEVLTTRPKTQEVYDPKTYNVQDEYKLDPIEEVMQGQIYDSNIEVTGEKYVIPAGAKVYVEVDMNAKVVVTNSNMFPFVDLEESVPMYEGFDFKSTSAASYRIWPVQNLDPDEYTFLTSIPETFDHDVEGYRSNQHSGQLFLSPDYIMVQLNGQTVFASVDSATFLTSGNQNQNPPGYSSGHASR